MPVRTEYLGHVVSRGGLKTSPRLVEAVQQFPVPKSVHDVRRFLGLSSYYRKFIRNFAKIASPIHQLTCKNARFIWTPNCQSAFEELKEHLTTPPVLAYPCFQRDFVLETDTSIFVTFSTDSWCAKRNRRRALDSCFKLASP